MRSPWCPFRLSPGYMRWLSNPGFWFCTYIFRIVSPRPFLCGLLAGLLFGLPIYASDQKNQTSAGGGTTTSPSSSGTATLTGITYPATQDGLPTAAPTGKHIRVFCFDLVPITDSPVQPFILVPAKLALGRSCSTLDDAHPLLFGDFLVIAVAIPDPAAPSTLASTDNGGFNRIKALSVNVTTQVATPINPAPVRPTVEPSSGSSGAAGGAGAGGGGAPGGGAPALTMPSVFYLKWPYSLLADVVPTVSISVVYDPPLSSTSVITTTAPPTPMQGVPASPSFTQKVDTVTLSQVPSGAQAVNLQNLTLPQVHALYYYNVTTGVAATFKRNPTFYQIASTSSPTTYTTTSSPGDYLVAPIILFTAYFPPMDAERSWNEKNLIPALSWGLSLSSPSTSFYVGASFEIQRNVQFVTGANIVKVTSLAPVPQTTSTPITQQNFATGPFIGLTVNIDFIKALFSGSAKSQ
jgi:hypothetical protein